MATQEAPILNLPDEILQHIFSIVRDEDILAVTQVCRRFYILSRLPIAWRARCTGFKFWESHHAYEVKMKHDNPSEVDWKRLFAIRRKSDKWVSELLDRIISSSVNKIRGFEQIAQEGYDAKDCLKKHLESSPEVEDVLARRYYASEALSFIHRKRAIEIWKKIGEGVDVTIEEAFGAFDLFVTRGANRDVEQISRTLDSIATQFHLQYPLDPTRSPKETASLLIQYMHSIGFVGAGRENYYNLRNSFLGICIDSTNDRTSLPITLVAIFCALGRRLGLDIKPLGLAFHCIALLTYYNEQGKANISFWDPFKTPLEIPRTHLEDSLRSIGINTDLPHLFTPSNIRELVVRVARNILESVRIHAAPHHIPQTIMVNPVVLSPTNTSTISNNSNNNDTVTILESSPFIPEHHAALYAALTASAICGPPASTRLLEHMCSLMQRDFSMDVGFFEADMARLINEDDALMLHNICKAVRAEDATPRKPNHRIKPDAANWGSSSPYVRESKETDTNPTEDSLLSQPPSSPPLSSFPSRLAIPIPGSDRVRYKIGTVFRHRRYGYIATITGWTVNCAIDENWIRDMDVDRLKRGRHQPFYNAFVADGSSRYVAEDSISELRPGVKGWRPSLPSLSEPSSDRGLGERLWFGPREFDVERETQEGFVGGASGVVEGGAGGGYGNGRGGVERLLEEEAWAGVERLSSFLPMGKYFRRFDRATGRFVSNLTEEYPDD